MSARWCPGLLWLVVVACGPRGRPDYATPEDDTGPRRAARPAMAKLAPQRGEITRADLDAALTAGPGALLSRVRVEAVGDQRGFKGWQIVSLPAAAGVWLQPGDIVTRVNGRGLERPEHLSALFEALHGTTEIVVEYERGGEQRERRVPVVE